MRKARYDIVFLSALLILLTNANATAQEEPFYQGFTSGGFYDRWSRLLAVPPGTPRDRVQLLRKAFADTLKDPEFIAEAKKVKLQVTHTSGEQIEKYVEEMLSITPKAKELLSFLMVKPKK